MKSIASALWKVIDTLARAVISLIARVSPKLGEKCLNLWNNTELVSYLFVGAATTLVNYVTYWFATRVLHTGVLLSNTIAWVVAVAFGYWANKTFVFKTHCKSFKELIKEAGSFFAMRLVSYGIDEFLMLVTVGIMHLPDLIMKIVINFVVIILNYVFSKKFVFKK